MQYFLMFKIMNINGVNYEFLMFFCSKIMDYKVYINYKLMFNKVFLIIRGIFRFIVIFFIFKI